MEYAAVVRAAHDVAPTERKDRPGLVLAAYVPVLVVVTAGFLFSPRAPAELHVCGHTIGLGRASFVLNCDSPSFITVAMRPSALFDWGDILQERPLYVVAAGALGHALGPALAAAGPVPPQAYEALADFSSRWRRIPPDQVFAAWLAYVLLNATVLLGALLAFHYVVAGWSAPGPGLVALASLLLSNDVVKSFFWTPHTQMFNVIGPVGCVVACRALLERADRRVLGVGALGLGLGLASLAYGSFAFWIPPLLVALALGRLDRTAFLVRASALVAGFAIPNAAWMATCMLSGEYYSHAVEFYRQFVWIVDTLRVGWGAFVSAWYSNSRTFLRVAWQVLPFPLGLLAGAIGWAWLAGVPLRGIVREQRTTVVAVGLTLAASLLFFDLQGFYAARLAWNLVPPLFILAALIERQIERNASPGWRTATVLAAICTALGMFAHEVVKAGPWV